MNSESLRIADQLRRAFTGDAWHGPPLRDALAGITPEQARTRSLPSAHTIWELVLHIDLWTRIALEATQETPMPKLYGTEKDWDKAADGDAAAWTRATENLFQTCEQLAKAIEGFDDSRLKDIVPGRQYDFYYLFHGIVQHSLYHGGQIAMLRRAVSPG
jgi:uncharacterized damage-inducible protein DinB